MQGNGVYVLASRVEKDRVQKASEVSMINEGRCPGCTIEPPSSAPNIHSRDRSKDPIHPPDNRNLILELHRPRIEESISSLLSLVSSSIYLTNDQKTDQVEALLPADQTNLLMALHTRNGDVASFNDPVTHCLGTNSNSVYLGSQQQVQTLLM